MTWVEFDLATGADIPALRRTDLVFEVDPEPGAGGSAAGLPIPPRRFVALFYGADSAGARTALARRGLRPAARPRAATGEDLLLAATHTGPSRAAAWS